MGDIVGHDPPSDRQRSKLSRCTDPEARGGQGQEHSRMRCDRLVDAFAAFEAGPYEMPGVASIQRGARRAAQLAARPTGFEDHVVGEVVA